jgi:hypothetical protein
MEYLKLPWRGGSPPPGPAPACIKDVVSLAFVQDTVPINDLQLMWDENITRRSAALNWFLVESKELANRNSLLVIFRNLLLT